jgi:hypothetical protein
MPHNFIEYKNVSINNPLSKDKTVVACFHWGEVPVRSLYLDPMLLDRRLTHLKGMCMGVEMEAAWQGKGSKKE